MKRLALCLLLLNVLTFGFAKNESGVIPPVPDPPRLVNDLAGVLDDSKVDEMERRLVAFNDSTTNVICVITVNDLGGYSPAQFAYEIGDRWGVRAKDKRNGVVILIKPGTGHGDGDVYISVGYDLEGAIPDAIAKRIIEQKMIPELTAGDYAAALDSALAYILPLAAGEISAEGLEEEDISFGEIILILCCIIVPIVIMFVLFDKNGGNGHYNGRNDGPTIFMGPTPFGGYGNIGSGTWGGGYSGGFGGFGGFGGAGGFGGGGAGGRF